MWDYEGNWLRSPLRADHRGPSVLPSNSRDGGDSSRSVVFQLASDATRDRVMQRATKLRDISTASILGLSGDGGYKRLFLRAMLPREVFQLQMRARDFARQHNLPAPLLRGIKIFMRASVNSQSVRIASDTDLRDFAQSLASNETRNPLRARKQAKSSLPRAKKSDNRRDSRQPSMGVEHPSPLIPQLANQPHPFALQPVPQSIPSATPLIPVYQPNLSNTATLIQPLSQLPMLPFTSSLPVHPTNQSIPCSTFPMTASPTGVPVGTSIYQPNSVGNQQPTFTLTTQYSSEPPP